MRKAVSPTVWLLITIALAVVIAVVLIFWFTGTQAQATKLSPTESAELAFKCLNPCAKSCKDICVPTATNDFSKTDACQANAKCPP